MNIVSFGGGTNSTAMIIGMYLHKIPIDLILFADTGAEQPHTYAFIDTFNSWLRAHSLPEIISVGYHDKNGTRLTLERECLNDHKLPAIAYGFKQCSLKHKIGTQEKFCNHYQPCKDVWARGERVHKFIGYDAGETRRIQHAAPADEANKKYENHYPLYEWNWSREECARVIEQAGLPTPGKSSCFFCPSMKKAEIQALWENYPELFDRAVELEHNAADSLQTVKGLGRRWSWESYHDQWMENKAFDDAQMSLFPDTPGGCLCNAPCGWLRRIGGSMNSPCKDCENRSPTCHTTCTPYLEARAVQIRQNTCGWGERMTDDYKSKIIQQTKKKYERRRWR